MRILLLCLLVVAGLSSLSAQPQFETTRVADGVYRFRFVGHNGFFVVGPRGVVAFDPISTEASRHYADEIKRVAPGADLVAIVYSHHDADHATGARVLEQAFGVTVPIIAQGNALPRLQERADPDLPPPTETYLDRVTVTYAGRPIELYYLGPNHSDNSTVAVVPDVRVAFAVDFVSNDRVGFRDLPGFYFPGLFESLERLANLEFDTIVLGHGDTGNKASVQRQIAYYRDLRNAVEAAHRNGQSLEQAEASVRLPAYESWGGYADWFPLNVRGMYRWVASRTNPVFP